MLSHGSINIILRFIARVKCRKLIYIYMYIYINKAHARTHIDNKQTLYMTIDAMICRRLFISSSNHCAIGSVVAFDDGRNCVHFKMLREINNECLVGTLNVRSIVLKSKMHFELLENDWLHRCMCVVRIIKSQIQMKTINIQWNRLVISLSLFIVMFDDVFIFKMQIQCTLNNFKKCYLF